LAKSYREITLESVDFGASVQAQTEACQHSVQVLKQQFGAWLRSEDFQPITDRFREEVQIGEEICLLLRTDQTWLRQLPWQEWDLLKRYKKAEVVLCNPTSERLLEPAQEYKTEQSQVQILAVLGNDDLIDTEGDRQFLQTFSPEAKTCFLPKPTREALFEALWSQRWDIFFFAGHSHTEGQHGVICLNDTELPLPITDLAQAMAKAIDNGLQIAIFNSCDGLGLAQDLEKLHIPHLVVMREPVPDAIAQRFLKNFLGAYCRDIPLHLAVRDARESLIIKETEFPSASHLPILCQSYTATSPTWTQLRTGKPTGGRIAWSKWERQPALIETNPVSQPYKAKTIVEKIVLVLVIGFSVTTLTFGIRWTGGFQVAELHSFDHLMRHRPIERADERLLIVEATTDDLYTYGLNNFSIRDEVFVELIDYLQTHGARVIGFNTLRDLPVSQNPVADAGNELFTKIRNTENLVASCFVDNNYEDSAAPPPGAPQVGFSDLEPDSAAGDRTDTIRRYTISQTPNQDDPQTSRCEAEISFALLTAYTYFEQESTSTVQIQSVETENSSRVWQVGTNELPRWQRHHGGYQLMEDDRGWQVVINYRNLRPGTIEEVGRTVSIGQLLDESQQQDFNPDWIRDRVVLIGTTSIQVDGKLLTPLGRMSRLSIQAHMVSDLIATALGERTPIRSWQPWQDFIWLLAWSSLSAIMATLKQSFLGIITVALVPAIAISLMAQFALSMFSIWIPLVPAIVASLGAMLVTKIWLDFESSKTTQGK
jgi:CHASE2 domain-containing sensor protein